MTIRCERCERTLSALTEKAAVSKAINEKWILAVPYHGTKILSAECPNCHHLSEHEARAKIADNIKTYDDVRRSA
jgi:hypothetical protein